MQGYWYNASYRSDSQIQNYSNKELLSDRERNGQGRKEKSINIVIILE